MQSTFFVVKDNWNIFKEIIDFIENLEITQSTGGGHVICIIMTHCVRKSICDSPLSSAIFVTTLNPFDCLRPILKIFGQFRHTWACPRDPAKRLFQFFYLLDVYE